MHPNAKEIMVSIGFVDIEKPGMPQSVGRFMTLEKGAKMKDIDWVNIVRVIDENEYALIKGGQI
jgi:aspartyl/asparaginyl beta-hydroxylase (cupin superfamily)